MTLEESEVDETLYNGFLIDSEPFREYLKGYFVDFGTADDDKWHVRDSLSGVWNAALDAKAGLELTRDEKRERALRIDKERWPKDSDSQLIERRRPDDTQ